MRATRRPGLAFVLLLLTLISASRSAPAQQPRAFTIGPTKAQVVGVVIAIVAVGVVIGAATVYLIRRNPSLTGCTASEAGNLILHNEADSQTFTLIGDTASLHPGDRIRIKGKKNKKDASGHRTFIVEKLTRNFGPCKISPAVP